MKSEPVIWLHLPVWQLREALEEPQHDSSEIAESRLWVASEWMIQCADPIFAEMSVNARDLNESETRVFRTGNLCDSAKLLGVERWQFWRDKFSQLGAGVNGDAAKHVSEALKSMDDAEAASGHH